MGHFCCSHVKWPLDFFQIHLGFPLRFVGPRARFGCFASRPGDLPKGAGRSPTDAHGRIEEHQITCPVADDTIMLWGFPAIVMGVTPKIAGGSISWKIPSFEMDDENRVPPWRNGNLHVGCLLSSPWVCQEYRINMIRTKNRKEGWLVRNKRNSIFEVAQGGQPNYPGK